MSHDPLAPLIHDAYRDVPVPPYPASAVAHVTTGEIAPRRRATVLQLSFAGSIGLVVGALVVSLSWPLHDRIVDGFAALGLHHEAQTDNGMHVISLDEARRAARFPLVVPSGVPVSSVEIAGDADTVRLDLEPHSGNHVVVLERPANTATGIPRGTWTKGSTAITVIVPAGTDSAILNRIRTLPPPP